MTRTRSNHQVASFKTDAQPAALVPAQEKNKPVKVQPTSAVVPQPNSLQPDGLQLDACASPLPRGSKQRLVLDLLRRNGGATLLELADATSWLPHTTRAALTRLRRSGHDVVRSRRGDGTSTYTCIGRTRSDNAQVS